MSQKKKKKLTFKLKQCLYTQDVVQQLQTKFQVSYLELVVHRSHKFTWKLDMKKKYTHLSRAMTPRSHNKCSKT